MYVRKAYVEKLLECESDPIDILAFIDRLYNLYIMINGDENNNTNTDINNMVYLI